MGMPPLGAASEQRRTKRDRAVDVLLFLLCLGFTAVTFIDTTDRQLEPVLSNIELLLGVLASLGLWLRRRWPVGVAVVVGLFSIYSVSASGVALIALFTVALHRRAVVAGLVAAGYGLSSFLTLLVRPDLPPPGLAQSVLGVVCVAAVLAWGMFARARRQLARTRDERAVSEQELRIAHARQSERDRIAREMHDVLGHRLSLLSLHAGALELWPDAPSGEIARVSGVIRESAHLAMEDLREVIGVLRTARTDDDAYRPQPTLAALPGLIAESRLAGMRVVMDCQVTDAESLPGAAGRTAYRIVQEGLTNARKHAPHAEVSLAVHASAADGVTVEIRNPCQPGSSVAGMGLIGLAERAGLAGGRLEHGHTDTGEFRLWAWLPWQK